MCVCARACVWSFISKPAFFIVFIVSVANPCDRKKCEWLCLLSPSGPVCTCPNDRVADNGTCVELPPSTEAPVSKLRLVTGVFLFIELSIVMKLIFFILACLFSHCTYSFSAPTCNVQCLNGGSCFMNARSQPKCRCPTSYSGERCEVDQCRDYCKNGGTCSPSRTGISHITLPNLRVKHVHMHPICLFLNNIRLNLVCWSSLAAVVFLYTDVRHC